MEKAYKNIYLLSVSILLVLIWGFYKTYIIHIPNFEGTGYNYIQHVHGILMITWVAFLIIQPILIKQRLYKIHRLIGVTSYFIVPILLCSIFMVSKTFYYRILSISTNEEAISTITGLCIIPAFALLYILAIANKRNIPKHMRYMIGTSLLLINPGLSRALYIFFGMGASGLAVSDYVAMAVVLFLTWYDRRHNKNYQPYIIILIVLIITHLVWLSRYLDIWQTIGKSIAQHFF